MADSARTRFRAGAGTSQERSGAPLSADSRTSNKSAASYSRPAYVREPKAHRSQPPVDDFKNAESPDANYVHETGYTLSNRNPISRGAYRRARVQESRIKQELKYGQYLSVPKGSREIFRSREMLRRRRLLVGGIVALALVIILLIVFWPK